MISRRFFLFLLSGGVAALANFCSRILFSMFVTYPVAIVLAYLVGMAVAFLLMRSLVFADATNRTHAQVAWFVVVNLLAVAQTLIISLLLARWLLPAMGVQTGAETIAHAVGVLVPVVTSYFGHKFLSFRRHAPSKMKRCCELARTPTNGSE